MKAVRRRQDSTSPANFEVATHPNDNATVAITAAIGVNY